MLRRALDFWLKVKERRGSKRIWKRQAEGESVKVSLRREDALR